MTGLNHLNLLGLVDGSSADRSSLVKKSPMEKVLWLLWIRKIKGKYINGPMKSHEIP
jgi:hypothetical protein